MAKTPPEKLAAALRANLKRRKQTPVVPSPTPSLTQSPGRPGEPPSGPTAKPAKKPPENRG
jgi:hypothetical protein